MKDMLKRVDKAVRDATSTEPRRGHLGASAIGNRCVAQAWYSFRWAYDVNHTGRIKRLFSRGHEEEDRLSRWLRMAGYEIRDYSQRLCFYDGPEAIHRYMCYDWDSQIPDYYTDVSQSPHHLALAKEAGRGPKQWGFVDHGGHFAGSNDGMIRGPLLPDGWGGVEYKTHGYKSFTDLMNKGVLSSKPVHYVQMQIYMKYLGLKWCLYVAVNKNDDDLYFEIIHYKEEVAEPNADKALQVILSRSRPPRITENPSWWECKFCDFRQLCHYDAPVEKNCRSCVYASPAADGQWHCGKFEQLIPKEFIPQGCDSWEPIK